MNTERLTTGTEELYKPIAADLFCGAGGISSGLRSAGLRVLAGMDNDKPALATFVRNFPEAIAIEEDAASLAPLSFMEKLNIEHGELDVLAGGPPCQGFSKNVPRSQRSLDDPRNSLVRTFLEYCDVLRPKIVVLENVAEMRNGFDKAYAEEVEETLTRLDYSVAHATLYARDYGIPQNRRRAFFIAAKGTQVPKFPATTHSKPADDTLLSILEEPEHVSVWDAIGDLPSLEHGEGEEPCEYASAPFSKFQELVRDNGNQVGNHVARYLRSTQHQRLSSVGPGQGMKDLPDYLKPNAGYSGAYGRLSKDMVAPTITRWVFHPGSGRFGHPVDIRTITIREAARLQAFPDSFTFTGTYIQQSHQVGNAVPPLLMERVARTLISQFSLCRRSRSAAKP